MTTNEISTSTVKPRLILRDMDGKAVVADDYVHQVGKIWVVAQWVERSACYIASMSPSARRLTGCSQVSARTVEGIVRDPCVPRYSSRAAAVRAAARIYGWTRE